MSSAGTLNELRQIAAQHGGRCLSEVYVNRQGVILWECGCGHQWNARASSIVNNGAWCPKCMRVRRSQIAKERNTQRLSIEDMRRTAAEHHGECLSEEYVNAHTKLRWKCEKGHEWAAVANSIRSGTWCPHCAGKRGSISLLDEAVSVATSRRGRCLSEEFLGDSVKLKWECSEKHQWEAVLYAIRKGSWCPECSGGLGERLLRACMEQLFQQSFPKTRPTWLKGFKGVPLELDGYCEVLGIAFEHHGIQHFRAVSWTQKSTSEENSKAFAAQKQRDERKLRLCEQNGVKVLVIPEVPALLAIEDVKAKIGQELDRLKIPFPEGFSEREVDFASVYSAPRMREAEDELQRLAAKRGGQLVPGSYRGMMEKSLWRCSEGHEWEAQCTSVKMGTWCPRCSGHIVTIEDMRELATAKGGSCLSTEYCGSKQKLLWSCGSGHQWKASSEQIKGGSWCRKCVVEKKRTGIEEMREIARKNGGECLSSEYRRAKDLLLWRCGLGHEWHASGGNVRSRRSWCPYCAGKGKVTLEMAEADARAKGGACLAAEITNVNTPVRWRCAAGHEWMAAPAKIRGKGKRGGTWCPHCAGRAAYSIEYAKNLALGRKGVCLSGEYLGAHGRLDWQCENGHRWTAVFNSIRQGSWCPDCPAGRGRRARLLAQDARSH